MKLGISSMAAVPKYLAQSDSNLPIEKVYLNWVEQSFQIAEKYHFAFIEIILESPLNSTVQSEFIQLCKDFRIPKTIHAPFLDINIIAADDYIRKVSLEEYQKAFEITAAIGAQTITIHPGHPIAELRFLQAQYRKWLVAGLSSIMKHYLIEYRDKFTLCLENMPQNCVIFTQRKEIQKILEIPELKELKLTLDTSHAWTNGGDTVLQDFMEFLCPKIAHFHLVDNISYESDPHIPIGKGKIDFNRFLQAVHQLKPQNNMVIELPGIKASVESRDLIQMIWDKL